MVTYAGAIDNLGSAIDHVQAALGNEIDKLATGIDQLSGKGTGVADVSQMSSPPMTDGAIVKLQFGINKLTGASEHATSMFTKAEGYSKGINRQINQGA
ncbi:MAG: hypothetical protein KKC80_07200 [Candidatus Margulisbacteria bacterium]|nr:hypothetical protein [Candidatus Margulisiibacteriota bacterium]MBU1616973.1 hypothetical protein [Candidatus Margulisiibacteriota bacterium]